MENRKNTILLTVIAIATLLVAVVGATFAYFSAQTGTGSQKRVEVTTHTTDSAMFNFNGDLTIAADQYNFSSDKSDISKTATATAEFQSGTGAASELCYTVTLSLTGNMPKANDSDPDVPKGNTFSYPTAQDITDYNIEGYDTKSAEEKAELVFTATKKTTYTLSATATEAKPDGLTETVTTIIGTVDGENVIPRDITELATNIAIPTTNGGSETIHRMPTTNGGDTIVDEWSFNITLKNRAWDQQYNTDKHFRATIDFVKVACPGA